jgi:hypothetical protein
MLSGGEHFPSAVSLENTMSDKLRVIPVSSLPETLRHVAFMAFPFLSTCARAASACGNHKVMSRVRYR